MTNQDQNFRNVQKALAERIKKLRKERKWPQKTLADLAGLSTYKLSQIEHGKVNLRLSILLALARAFNMKMPQLFHDIA